MRPSLRAAVGLVIAAYVTMLSACAPSNGSVPDLPARPFEIPVAGIAPCSALSTDQLQDLQLNPGKTETTYVDGVRSSGCSWTGEGRIGYTLQTIPISAQRAASQPGAVITQVNGFGAAQTSPAGSRPLCQITIDAADGQAIRVQAQVLPSGDGPAADSASICTLADEAARHMLETITKDHR